MSDFFDETIRDGGPTKYPIIYKDRCRRCGIEIISKTRKPLCSRCTAKGLDHAKRLVGKAKRPLTTEEFQEDMRLDKKYHLHGN